MKRLIFITCFIFSIGASFGQGFPNSVSQDNTNTLRQFNGAIHPALGFIPPFLDTLNNPATSYNGAYIQNPNDSRPYFSDGVKWIPFQVGTKPDLIAHSPVIYDNTTGTISVDTISILGTKTDLLNKWSITGNSTNETNFLGTNNNSTLRFNTNGTLRAYIDSSSGNFVERNGIWADSAGIKLYGSSGNRFLDVNNNFSIRLNGTNATQIQFTTANVNLISAGDVTVSPTGTNGATPFNFSTNGYQAQLSVGQTQNDAAEKYAVFRGKDYNDLGNGKPFHVMIYGGTETGSGNKGNIILAHDGSAKKGNVIIGALTGGASAILNVQSTTQGVVFPRMSGAQMNAISSPAMGLMIYNNDSTSYCYFNGAIWIKFGGSSSVSGGSVVAVAKGYGIDTTGGTITGSGTIRVDTTATTGGLSNKYLRLIDVTADWHLTGNSGTDTSVNFIGTKDGHNLRFKVNNIPSGIIDYTGNNNTSLGYQTLLNNTSGGANSAFGNNTLKQNTTGAQNTAIGAGAMFANTTGASNVAIGYQALIANTTGNNNMAIGLSMTSNTTGSSNTAVGNQNLQNNTTGNNNVAIGYNALLNNTIGSNNIAIGYGAMLPYNTSNRANFANSIWITSKNGHDSVAGTTDLVAIGNIAPTSMFNVGTANQFQTSSTGDLVKIKNVTYGWPNSEGITNGALVNDGAGNLTWILIDTLNLASGYHTQNYFNTVYAPISSVTGTNWVQEGNTITPGVSFLGTNNNASLLIKTNGVTHVKVDSLGDVYIGNATTDPHLFNMNDISQMAIHSTKTPHAGAYILLNSANRSSDSGSAMITIRNWAGVSGASGALFRVRTALNSVITDLIVTDISGRTVIDSAVGAATTPSAMLDIRSNSRGVKFPTLNTTQMNAISSPAIGLMLYNNDSASIVIWNGAKWAKLGGGSSGGGGGSGTVISVGSGYGLLGGPITSTGTLLVDTSGNGLSTKLWRQKGVDSLSALILLRQLALSGTGFVKIAGTTISYDNSTYLTAATVSGKLDSVKRSGTSNIIQQWKNAGTATTAFIDQGLVDSVINISTTVQRTYYTSGTTLDNTFAVDSIFFTGDVIGSGLLNIPLTITTTPSLSIYADLGGDIVAEGMTNISQLKAQTTFAAGQRVTILRVPSARVITGIEFLLNTAGVYTGTAYNGFGLYSYNKTSGVCTLVASSTNNATLWSNGGVTGTVHQAFSTPYTAPAGTYYLLTSYNQSAVTTNPVIASGDVWQNNKVPQLGTFINSGKIAASITGVITSLPSSFNISTATATTSDYYFAGYQ